MNKQLKIYGGLALAAILGLSLYFAIRPAAQSAQGDAHDPATEEAHTEGEHAENPMIKEVHLNQAQYQAAGVVLGGFEQKNLSDVINANGYTKLPPQNQAQVSVLLSGIIKTIKVIEGQYVKTGQVLATMQSMAYNNLRLERAKLQEQLSGSQANLEYLQQEFTRQKELSEENVNARKVFQKVSADLNAEEGKVKALQAQITILSQNIQISGNANSPLISITSPISGHITEVNVTIGLAVEGSKPLFSIVDNSKMHLDLLVYEKDLFRVKPGQSVRFVLTNQNDQEIRGKIFSVGKSFENETKSVAVHADIVNEKQMLIPGMYVNALIDVGSEAVDALPLEAVVKAEGREFIFVLEEASESTDHDEAEGHAHEDGHEHEEGKGEAGQEFHFQRIEVKTGTSQLGYVQVMPLQALQPGSKIVVKGAYYLQSHLTKSEGGGGHDH